MRYQVPQFIGVEDKIFGPLTIKQFIYVAAGAAIAVMLWLLIPKFLALLIGAPILVFFLVLAFYRYNDRPFIFAVENAVKYYVNSKLYIWDKKQKTIEDSAKVAEKKRVANQQEGGDGQESLLKIPKLSDSKLNELSWSLDINESLEEKS